MPSTRDPPLYTLTGAETAERLGHASAQHFWALWELDVSVFWLEASFAIDIMQRYSTECRYLSYKEMYSF